MYFILFIDMLNVITVSVILLNVITVSVILLNVFVLNVLSKVSLLDLIFNKHNLLKQAYFA